LTLDTPLGYNSCIQENNDLTFLFFRRDDEKVLLRNLASVHDYKKTDFDSRNCKLSCYVLKRHRPFLLFYNRPVLGGFFMRPKSIKHLTRPGWQIKLMKNKYPI
jgi:hypothetical protein